MKLAVFTLLLALLGATSYGHQPPGPIVTATGVGSSCGMNNGAITADASGGTPPYLFSINGSPKGTGTYIWSATGIDYQGHRIERKGTVVLMR